MENTLSGFEIKLVAPTKLKVLKKELTERKRRLARAQVRQLLFL
jgi:hypothetical protein